QRWTRLDRRFEAMVHRQNRTIKNAQDRTCPNIELRLVRFRCVIASQDHAPPTMERATDIGEASLSLARASESVSWATSEISDITQRNFPLDDGRMSSTRSTSMRAPAPTISRKSAAICCGTDSGISAPATSRTLK